MKELDKQRCGANVEKVIIDEFVPSKAIDNANPSDALKCLVKLRCSCFYDEDRAEYVEHTQEYANIKLALLKMQKQEKALDEIQTIMDNWLINGQYESNYALEKIDKVLEELIVK